MQSEMAQFASVPPPGELDESYASILILANSLHYAKTRHHQPKPEVHNVLHYPERTTKPQPQVTRTGKFVEIWTCGF